MLMLLGSLFCNPLSVRAQIAPTNSATISGSVSDSSGKPVANAKVSLSGPRSAVAQSDAHGLFVFVGVPFGTYIVTATATGLGTATRSLMVEGDTNVAIAYTASLVNGFKVIAQVGSTANAVFNITSASVSQVDPIQSAFDGQTSWRTILEQIPGVSQSGVGNGSSGGGVSDMPDSPFHPTTISIDGALPYETAISLDGMPLIGSAITSAAGEGTDLSDIALNSFSSADVVRGPGANAPSIVDSVGGSLVMHTLGIVNQSHYDLSLSTDPYGGIVANTLAAVRWKKLSVVVTYGVNDSPGPITSGGAFAPLYGLSAVNGNAFTAATCGSTPCGITHNTNYGNGGGIEGYTTPLLTCCFNLSSAWSQHSGSIALTYALSPSVSAAFYYTGESERENPLAPNYLVNFMPSAGYAGAIPFGTSIMNYSAGYVGGSCQDTLTSSLLEEKITAQLGRGILRFAALQNRDFFTNGGGSPPISFTAQLFGGGNVCSNTSPGCTTGTYIPTIFNGGTFTLTSPFQYNFDEDFTTQSHDFLISYDTPLGERFHAGASLVNSSYNTLFAFLPGTFILPGGIVFPCPPEIIDPSSAYQVTNELRVYAGGNFSEKTSLDLSMYLVNADYHVPNPNGYSIFTGSSPNGYVDKRYSYAAPRLGFVWRPTTSIAVRAAAGGGFAEAPLEELTGSNGVPQINSPSTPLYYSESLENLNLQPEKSFAFTLGADIRLRRETVLSFDVYRANLFGQFYTSAMQNGTYTGAYGTLPLYISQNGNLGESRYEGALLNLRHDVAHGFYWALSGGLTRGYLVSLPGGFYNTAGHTCIPATGANCQNLTVVPGPNFNGTFTPAVGGSIPYSQGLGRFGYRWNSEKYVDLVGTYFGNNNSYYRPAFVEFDGHIGYPLSRHISLLMTFRNITGLYDSPMQLLSPTVGAPTISGLPYPLYGEMYGPRTVTLTTNVRM